MVSAAFIEIEGRHDDEKEQNSSNTDVHTRSIYGDRGLSGAHSHIVDRKR